MRGDRNMNQFTEECFYAAADYEPSFSIKHDYDGEYYGQPSADPYYGGSCDTAAAGAGYCDYGYDTAVAFNGTWSSSHQAYPPFDGQQQHTQPLPYACAWTPPDDDRPPPTQQPLQQSSPHELPLSLSAIVPEPTDFCADDEQRRSAVEHVAFHHPHQSQRDDTIADQNTADAFSEFNDRPRLLQELCVFALPTLI